MSRKNEDEFSSGENADYSDLELDPETGQIDSVGAEGEQVTVASSFFDPSLEGNYYKITEEEFFKP